MHNIILVGATGNLGLRIAEALAKNNTPTRALVRKTSEPLKIEKLKSLGIQLIEVDFNDPQSLVQALKGGTCVISTVSGLGSVIVDLQVRLLNAAVAAGVTRFIPSDFSIDYTKLKPGSNRNLDARRELNLILDQSTIKATSILNGAFADMLTGQAPIVLFKWKRILYWGNADQKMDFTTINDVARYTAAAATDDNSPRYLRIAGDQVTIKDLANTMTAVTRAEFKPLYAGGLLVLKNLSRLTKKLMPVTDDLYPPWQGMQYLHNMYEGLALFPKLDNDRYFKKSWTKTSDVLTRYVNSQSEV